MVAFWACVLATPVLLWQLPGSWLLAGVGALVIGAGLLFVAGSHIERGVLSTLVLLAVGGFLHTLEVEPGDLELLRTTARAAVLWGAGTVFVISWGAVLAGK